MRLYSVGYIFTEAFFDIFKSYIHLNVLINSIISIILSVTKNVLPYLVKNLIGYCNFYYQLGYGIIFYIYIFRRYKSKKYNNWNSFYGASISNWVLFNTALFNKFIFSVNFNLYVKTILTRSALIVFFWFDNFNKSAHVCKTRNVLNTFIQKNTNYIWTPLFKRTSYIAFFTFLRRFTKRK